MMIYDGDTWSVKHLGTNNKCTYQKDEEHKEHKRSEINWSQNSISFLHLCEVDVTQNDTELSEATKTKQSTTPQYENKERPAFFWHNIS